MDFHFYYIIIVYLFLVNIIGYALMDIDKRRAIRHEWRIREATLFFVAAIGGSLGSLLGMYIFRHKTKHRYFVIGMPALLTVHTVILILLYLFTPLFH